jgi:hypothetical protein
VQDGFQSPFLGGLLELAPPTLPKLYAVRFPFAYSVKDLMGLQIESFRSAA